MTRSTQTDCVVPEMLGTVSDAVIAMRDVIWYWMRTIGNEDKPMTTRTFALLVALGCARTVQAQEPTLITTFTNPIPALLDLFAISVASVGSDRILIGASEDGRGYSSAEAAYLFSTNGTLLTTITNPTPASFDNFASAVAAVGGDKLLVGAYRDDTGAVDAGSAYLFSTNGILLSTFANPTPMAFDRFGYSVAAVGSDRILIGAKSDSTGALHTGAAYLFNTSASLLTTFTNPTPAASDWFGSSVAAVGRDRILIGSYQDDTGATDAGAAYLFSTNGTILATFIDPNPEAYDNLGFSVAAVGNDRVLIGAPGYYTSNRPGAVHLFNTNGTLLTTFTNPAPPTIDYFGYSVAAVGSDRVLIGAFGDDSGAVDAGAVYMFSTNGLLLTVFTNPFPAYRDRFGSAVTGVGSDHVLIGSHLDDNVVEDSGTAYLYSLNPPTLTILPATPGNATISWSPSTPSFVLQETEALSPVNWTNSPSGAMNPVEVPTTSTGKYFRLIKP